MSRIKKPTKQQVVAATGAVAVAVLGAVVVRQQRQINLLTGGVNLLGYVAKNHADSISDIGDAVSQMDEAIGFVAEMTGVL
jgi:hypothetical protein